MIHTCVVHMTTKILHGYVMVYVFTVTLHFLLVDAVVMTSLSYIDILQLNMTVLTVSV